MAVDGGGKARRGKGRRRQWVVAKGGVESVAKGIVESVVKGNMEGRERVHCVGRSPEKEGEGEVVLAGGEDGGMDESLVEIEHDSRRGQAEAGAAARGAQRRVGCAGAGTGIGGGTTLESGIADIHSDRDIHSGGSR